MACKAIGFSVIIHARRKEGVLNAKKLLIATNGVYKAILPAKSMLLLVSQKRKVHGMYVQVCN